MNNRTLQETIDSGSSVMMFTKPDLKWNNGLKLVFVQSLSTINVGYKQQPFLIVSTISIYVNVEKRTKKQAKLIVKRSGWSVIGCIWFTVLKYKLTAASSNTENECVS